MAASAALLDGAVPSERSLTWGKAVRLLVYAPAVPETLMEDLSLDIQLPATACNPDVVSLCREYWPGGSKNKWNKSLSPYCEGPAYVYSALAASLLWTSIFSLTLLAGALSECADVGGAAVYPLWLFVPMALSMAVAFFLELQALRYTLLPLVARLPNDPFVVDPFGRVSFGVWLSYHSLMSWLQMSSKYMTALNAATQLRAYSQCESGGAMDAWRHFMDKVPLLGSVGIDRGSANLGVFMMLFWLVSLIPVARAWTQNVTLPCIQSRHIPWQQKEWSGKDNTAVNYAVTIDVGEKGQWKEVRWYSLALKLGLDAQWVNFGIGLLSNAKVCGLSALTAHQYRKSFQTRAQVEELQRNDKNWLKQATQKAFYRNTLIWSDLVDLVLTTGLSLIIQVTSFSLHRSLLTSPIPLFDNWQLALPILLSVGISGLKLVSLMKNQMQTSMLVGMCAEAAERKRGQIEAERAKDPDFPQGGWKHAVKAVSDYDNAHRHVRYIVFGFALNFAMLIFVVLVLAVAYWQWPPSL